MIKPFKLRHASPARRVVTRLARRGEATLVGICVAPSAFFKGEPCIFHIRLRIGNGNMALGASNSFVHPGQWIF